MGVYMYFRFNCLGLLFVNAPNATIYNWGWFWWVCTTCVYPSDGSIVYAITSHFVISQMICRQVL